MHIVETITQSRPCVCMCQHRITVRTYAKETPAGVFCTGHMRGTTPTPPVPTNQSIAEWEAENTTPKCKRKPIKIVRQSNRSGVAREIIEQNEFYVLIRETEFVNGVLANSQLELINLVDMSLETYTPLFKDYLMSEYFSRNNN